MDLSSFSDEDLIKEVMNRGLAEEVMEGEAEAEEESEDMEEESEDSGKSYDERGFSFSNPLDIAGR
jgi:hypothetical protein